MSDFESLIDKQLGTKGRVDLPGLGSLYLKRIPAEIDHSENVIIPPQQTINYDQFNVDNDAYLPTDISNKDTIQHIHINNQLNNFVREVNEVINNGQRYRINNIGSFRADNQLIVFEPDPNSTHIVYGSELKAIHFTPVRKSDIQPNGHMATTDNQPSFGRKYKKWVIPFILVLLVINICLISYAFISQYQTDLFKSMRINLPEGRLNVKPTDGNVLPDAPVLPSEKEEESESDSSDLQIIEEDTTVQFQSLHSELEEEWDNKTEETAPVESKVTPKAPLPKKAINHPGELNAAVSKMKALNKENGDCAIVLGAFAVPSNLERMKNTLEGEGYFVFTEKGIKLTKIGIIVPCNSSSSALRIARKHYNPEAWIYQINE